MQKEEEKKNGGAEAPDKDLLFVMGTKMANFFWVGSLHYDSMPLETRGVSAITESSTFPPSPIQKE
jgi:hypothetical protein